MEFGFAWIPQPPTASAIEHKNIKVTIWFVQSPRPPSSVWAICLAGNSVPHHVTYVIIEALRALRTLHMKRRTNIQRCAVASDSENWPEGWSLRTSGEPRFVSLPFVGLAGELARRSMTRQFLSWQSEIPSRKGLPLKPAWLSFSAQVQQMQVFRLYNPLT